MTPQGLQLVDFNLVVLDIFRELLIYDICYPFRIFIECETSVSAPCLASITKEIYEAQRLDTI